MARVYPNPFTLEWKIKIRHNDLTKFWTKFKIDIICDSKNYINNNQYRFGSDLNNSNNNNNNNINSAANNMISISTAGLKSSCQQQHIVLQQPVLNNLSPNFGPSVRNNRLGQKYLINSNSNYYESFAVNQLPPPCNNSISPLIK